MRVSCTNRERFLNGMALVKFTNMPESERNQIIRALCLPLPDNERRNAARSCARGTEAKRAVDRLIKYDLL